MGLGIVALADIDVLAERDDRHVDVAVRRRGIPELGQQILRGRLHRRHLAGVGHRSGVVEHQRDAQAAVAPFHRGRASDVEARIAQELHERGVHLGRCHDRQLRSAGRGVGRRDGEVLGLRVAEHRLEIGGGLRLQLALGQCRRELRHRERGCVERRLEPGLDRIRAAVIDGGADQTEHRNDRRARTSARRCRADPAGNARTTWDMSWSCTLRQIAPKPFTFFESHTQLSGHVVDHSLTMLRPRNPPGVIIRHRAPAAACGR